MPLIQMPAHPHTGTRIHENLNQVAAMLFLPLVLAAAERRKLREIDFEYRLDEYNANFATRAPLLFDSDASFRRRMSEHEAGLPSWQAQSFVASLQPGTEASMTIGALLEKRVGLKLHSVVGGDLLMHGSREAAAALREQPEVRRVVPLLPELKISPHFEQLLPINTTKVALNGRLLPQGRRDPARVVAERVAAAHSRRCAHASEWRGQGSCDHGHSTLRVRVESERTLVIEQVPRAEALELARVLAEEPALLWLEPHAMYRTMNADAAAITQSGDTPTGTSCTQPGTGCPIWDMGIHGEGEIIGVGDSGLDEGHCFFEQAPG